MLVEKRKNIILERKLKSISWDDFQNASNRIANELIKKYEPTIIYIPNVKSGIMLQFMKSHFKNYIPVFVGHTISKEYYTEDAKNKLKKRDDYWFVDTNKWYTYIPKVLLEYKDQNILIIDNLSLTGNFLKEITKELTKHGIPEEHIATACIATTEAAIADQTAPQFYYKTLTDSKTVYMPWV